jgi:hypothetical protein
VSSATISAIIVKSLGMILKTSATRRAPEWPRRATREQPMRSPDRERACGVLSECWQVSTALIGMRLPQPGHLPWDRASTSPLQTATQCHNRSKTYHFDWWHERKSDWKAIE